MKKIITLLLLTVCVSSCSVTESIVINDDGSGQFLVTYDMGEVMKQMGDAFTQSGNSGADASEEKEAGKIMDTTMVFADIMEEFKDSVAALPEDKRLAIEAVKDMYMTMKMNEDKGEMNFGIGMNFKSIQDLKDIQDKLKKVQSLNAQGDQVEAMKSGSPLGNFMGREDSKVSYDYTASGFSRVSTINMEGLEDPEMEDFFNEYDESNQQFMEYFENAFYNVKLTFPKQIKSTSIEGAVISEDRKTITYKTNWIDYLKDPKNLDVDIKFVNE